MASGPDEPPDAVALDPTREGWHRGTVELPSRPGCPATHLPAVSVRGGSGPGVLIVCLDGDPLTAAAVAALALELDPADLPGGCVLVPDASGAGADAAEALDALLGGPTHLVLELGAGDPALAWSPAAIVHLAPGSRRGAHGDPAAEAAMVAFGAPESLRLHGASPHAPTGAAHRPDIDLGVPDGADGADGVDGAGRTGGTGSRGSLGPSALATLSRRRGVAHVEVRCGGPDAGGRLALLRAGCRNVLVQAGALRAGIELRSSRHVELGTPDTRREVGASIVAGAHGRLEMQAMPGTDVHAGSVLARVTDPARPTAEPAELLAPCDGILLARRADGPMAPGDVVALIADPMQP